MFKLKDHLCNIGGAIGGGKASGTASSRTGATGTKRQTGSKKAVQVGRKKGSTATTTAKNSTVGNKSNTQGSKTSASQTAATGSKATKGTTATTGIKSTAGNRKTSGVSNRTGTVAGNNRTTGVNKNTGRVNTGTTGSTVNKGTSAGSTQSSLQQTLSSLDAGTQAQLDSILTAIGSPTDAAALQETLTTRALNADNALNGTTADIVAGARRSGEKDIVSTVTNLSKNAGSSQNSLVQQIGLEASVDLETELAALEASLFRDNRQVATNELTGASQNQVGGVTSIANILKGAQQTTQQTAGQINNNATTSVGNNNTNVNQVNSATQIIDQNVANSQTTAQQNVTDQTVASTQQQKNAQNVVSNQNVSTAQNTATTSQQQTQQLVDALQTAASTGSTQQLVDILNVIQNNSTSKTKADVNQSTNAQGQTNSKNIGGSLFGGVSL